MLRRFQASFVLLVCLCLVSISVPAAAQDPTNEPAAAPPPAAPPLTPPPAPAEVKPAADPGSWQFDANGYFRAPMAIGLSSRPPPERDPVTNLPVGPAKAQWSYAPNRTMDWSYFSFAYTRLQELDWAEVFIHAKKKHVDAAIGWMGYWFQAVGFRNPDAGWAPGLAYLALDTDFGVGRLTPNIELKVGAFWPGFGYFEKYDTFTLGRFRQIGGQLKLTAPVSPDATWTITPGFGTNRDGSFNYGSPPFFGAITGLDLMAWLNAKFAYKRIFDISGHYSTEWTADPNLWSQQMVTDKSYTVASLGHLTVLGAEMNVRLPQLGHLWISPSFIHVRNGWALASAGTEVMHGLGGFGIATNYLGWTGSSGDSTGSGSLINLGFLYENSLSNLGGQAPGSVLPDLTLSIFGLLADASLDLPAGSIIHQNSIKQFKIGADLTAQTATWLAFMLRGDAVNYDLDNPGYVFAAITTRAIVSSHFLSSERIYLQYSRYIYGDKMVLAGTWPWGAPLVAGTNVLQQGPYAFQKGDANVIKLQAECAF